MDPYYKSLIDRNPFGGPQKDQFADLWVPEVRGHYKDPTGRFVSISTSQGPQWVGLGQVTPDGYKVLDYNEETGDTKLEYKGMPFTMPMHKSVILPTVNNNPQLTTYKDFGGGLSSETDEQLMKEFKRVQEQTALIPSLGVLGDPATHLNGSPSHDDDGSHPAYTFSPDIMEQIKKNYEASGGDSSNVLTLKEFREKQSNGKLDPNISYLVPMTSPNGTTDFQLWKSTPPESNDGN